MVPDTRREEKKKPRNYAWYARKANKQVRVRVSLPIEQRVLHWQEFDLIEWPIGRNITMSSFGERSVLRRTVGASSTKNGSAVSSTCSLSLAFLGCEDHPPYGPYLNTATMFLELFAKGIAQVLKNNATLSSCNLQITIYECKQGDFPTSQEEWDSFDGFICPGSFSSAYEQEEWILTMGEIMQRELLQKKRPTLGVCFGHQLLAHSFGKAQGGQAAKVPAGPQAGRLPMSLAVPLFFDRDDQEAVPLYYTHGDQVVQVPDSAVVLGGNNIVPVQSIAYFDCPQDAQAWKDATKNQTVNDKQLPSPIAIAFQAHPEYATDPALHTASGSNTSTLEKVLDAMHARGDISEDSYQSIKEDMTCSAKRVEQESLQLILMAAKHLGWPPFASAQR